MIFGLPWTWTGTNSLILQETTLQTYQVWNPEKISPKLAKISVFGWKCQIVERRGTKCVTFVSSSPNLCYKKNETGNHRRLRPSISNPSIIQSFDSNLIRHHLNQSSISQQISTLNRTTIKNSLYNQQIAIIKQTFNTIELSSKIYNLRFQIYLTFQFFDYQFQIVSLRLYFTQNSSFDFSNSKPFRCPNTIIKLYSLVRKLGIAKIW